MTTPPMKSIGLPKNLERDLDSYVRDRGVPVLSAPQPAKPVAAAKSNAASRRLSVDVPDYVKRALKQLSVERDVTVRFVVLEAFQKAGMTIHPEDFIEDGRRQSDAA